MTGIHITLKGEGLTADLKGWNPSFLEYYNSSKEEMNEVYDEYTKRII